MISRYVPLGLLSILLFFSCSTIPEKKVPISDEISLDYKIDLIIDEFQHQPEVLLEKLKDLIGSENSSYNPLLARLELSIGRFDDSIKTIEMIPDYKNNIDNLKIIIIAKMSLFKDYNPEIDQTLILDPFNTFVTNIRAQDKLKNRELDRAEELINGLKSKNRANSDSYIVLGDISLKKVDALNLKNKKVLSSREDALVTALYNEALDNYLKADKSSSSLFYIKISDIYKKLGNKLEAIKALDRAIALNPFDPWSFYDRGKLYSAANSEEKALDDFLKAYELDSNHFFTNVYLGRIYFSRGEIRNSLFHYEKVLEMNPDYSPAYKDLSAIYYIIGDKEKSLSFLTKLYGSKTDKDPLLSLYLVNTLIEVGRESDAKNILQNLVKYEKNSTIKGIYYYYLDPNRTGEQALNEALLLEDQYQRMRLTYYVSCALFRGGVYSLSDALFTEVADSNIGLESKLAKYKLGVYNE